MGVRKKYLKITIWVTDACNLSCTYCYEGGKKKPTNMTTETASQAVKWIQNLVIENRVNFLIVRFHGGEPMLNIQVIRYIIASINKEKPCSVIYEITTNGYNIAEGDLDYICSNIDNNADNSSIKHIYNLLKTTLKDKTVIIITHQIDMLENVDTIIKLEKGKIVKVK